MLEQMTIADLMRIVFWGVAVIVPLGLYEIAKVDMAETKASDYVTPSPFYLLAFAAQLAFGVACYIAGVRS